MPNQTCPSCRKAATGRFCSHCGAALKARTQCRECSKPLPAGARFCTECGAEAAEANDAAGSAAGASARAPWILTGIAVVALVGAVLLPRFREQPVQPGAFPTPVAQPVGMGMGAPGSQGVDLASMSPREAADRLFDRVMRTAATGDTAAALGFVPMALDAYAMLDEMDEDAHYHVGVLHLLNGEPEAARASADEILATAPTHLFGLITAAQSEGRLGNREQALDFYRRFLEAYPAEITRDLPEYAAHEPAMPEMRAEAQAALANSR